ncbi:MAG: pyridoxamine 5'-phosphate oxidase family protein [Marmoricola sp.]
MEELADVARRTLADNRYMVLGTVDPSGRPRVSPLWFSLIDHRVAYWLSSPESHHSRNIVQRPEVTMVVFDSGADPYNGQAVYLQATAERVPEDELGVACEEAFRGVDAALSFDPLTLKGKPFDLFRARITGAEAHVRGRDLGDGSGSDQRVPVEL